MIATEQLGRRARRGEIDRDFVAQRAPVCALVRDERFKRKTRRVKSMWTKHPSLTIGSGPNVVKNKRRSYDARMGKECPMCAEFMRLVAREVVTRVPGTSQEVKSTVREWVCPECDYFEDAEAGDLPDS